MNLHRPNTMLAVLRIVLFLLPVCARKSQAFSPVGFVDTSSQQQQKQQQSQPSFSASRTHLKQQTYPETSFTQHHYCTVKRSKLGFIGSTGIDTKRQSTVLLAVQNNKETQQQEKTEESISDVDARVLQEMLRESKLDLETAEDVRKLLERGTVKSTPKAPSSAKQKQDQEEDQSGFSSTIFKTFSDSKFWKSLQAKSAEVAESVGIWVANKVEQDVKTLAALGLFAWDRAVRDVARALPEVRQQAAKTVFMLSNSSAYDEEKFRKQQEEWERKKTRERELFKPADEIKSVSKEVFNILTGGTTTSSTASSGRGLRTIAPAGAANAAERQRRAFIQSQKLQKQKKDIKRLPGSVVDTAWELKRELKAERNAPGYKTKPIRKALAAAASEAGYLLQEAGFQARLAAAKRKEMRALAASTTNQTTITTSTTTTAAAVNPTATTTTTATVVPPTTIESSTTNTVPFDVSKDALTDLQEKEAIQALLDELQDRLDELADRLNYCIEEPGKSWLRGVDDQKNLRKTVTKMIILRNEVEVETTRPFTVNNAEIRLKDVQSIRKNVDEMCKLAAKDISDKVSGQLRNSLVYGTMDPSSNQALLSQLDTLSARLAVALQETSIRQEQEQQQSATSLGAGSSVANTSVVEEEVGAFFAKAEEVVMDATFGEAAVLPKKKKKTTNVSEAKKQKSKANIVEDKESALQAETVGSDKKQTKPKAAIVEVEAMPKETALLIKTKSKEATIITPEFVDVIPDKIMSSAASDFSGSIDVIVEGSNTVSTAVANKTVLLDEGMDAASAGLVAEIVTEDDFENAVGVAKVAESVSDEQAAKEKQLEEEKKEPDMIVQVALRSLDVIFFLLEKILLVGVPAAIAVTATAIARYENVKNEGKGSKGWETYSKLSKNAKGRY